MTPREKRFYLAGYFRAKRECEQLAVELYGALDEVSAELADVKSEIVRRYQIDEANAAERDPETWVN